MILKLAMNLPYRPLANEIRNHGHTMRLVKRVGNVAMYSKGNGFEVIKVGQHPGGKMFDKDIPPHETYPSDEQFGRNGWHLMTRTEADKMFDRLVAKASTAAVDQVAEDLDDGAVNEAAEKVVDGLVE